MGHQFDAADSLERHLVGFYESLEPHERLELKSRMWARLDPLTRFRLSTDDSILSAQQWNLVEQLRLSLADSRSTQPWAPDHPPPQARSITLITKATRLCNLRCTYCNDWAIGPGQSMSFETMARVTAAALGDPEHASVTFLWHGGEPTLLGQQWFERALFVQALLRQPGQTIRNEMQTNATRVTDDFAAFAARCDITLGASIDGPPDVHNRTRLYADGRPSWADVRQGLRVLERHGHATSVLMVVDSEILELGAQAVFDALVAEGITGVGLLAAKPTNQPGAAPGTPTDHYVPPARAAQFIIDLDACRTAAGIDFSIREADDTLLRIGGADVVDCTLGSDCVGQFYIVEPNGDIAHCDNFLGDPDYQFGNITTQTFAEVRSDPRMQRLVEQNKAELEAMSSCPGFDVCQGWCPHERYTSRHHNPDHDPGCCGRLPLIDHFRHDRRARVPSGVAVSLSAPRRSGPQEARDEPRPTR